MLGFHTVQQDLSIVEFKVIDDEKEGLMSGKENKSANDANLFN